MTLLTAFLLAGLATGPEDPSTAQLLGWPAGLADDYAPGLQEEDRKNEFAININLWPILESTTLSTGERRTALWPLFHVSTNADGSNHSWHVLTFLSGSDYHMFLPLYYVSDQDYGILPPVFLGGARYWASFPLLSGQWTYDDGDRTTWITPFFHLTADPAGHARSLHALLYFQGEKSWLFPPLLMGGGTYDDGTQVTWVTPLFHYTSDGQGRLINMHAVAYMQSRTSWAILPLLTWQHRSKEDTIATWITPLFHWSETPQGDFVSTHVGPYIQGRDYWMFLPLAGGGTHDDGGTSTWITPLFHVTKTKDGTVESYHVGPYIEGKSWWTIPPLLTCGWTTSPSKKEHWTTTALLFWLHQDEEGTPVSSTLFPVYFWVRDDWWLVVPAFTGHWSYGDGAETTWATPLFHRTTNKNGDVSSYHVGLYFEGEGYWAIPPAFSWHVRHSDGSDTTWITPLFHLHEDAAGTVHSLHVGIYFQGDDYWAVPPLLSWHTRYADGVETLWLTPAFHLTWDKEGSVSSAHLFPLAFWERDSYWAVPPLLSGGGRYADGSWTTWATPLVHVAGDADDRLTALHVAPFWFWGRDDYWTVPPLLIGGGTHADGAQTLWVTPLFHDTVDKNGALESVHVLPLWFWKRDAYWTVPLLLTGGNTRPDGSTRTWITPLYHDDYTKDGELTSRHVLNYFDGPDYHHIVPIFWDWRTREQIRHTMVPPLYFRTEEANGDTTTSLPWPILSVRTGNALDTSLGMELRPFLYQEAGEQMEFNFLWRIFSILRDEDSTRVMVGPLWRSEKPVKEDAMTKFQILGGLFARDCNYETNRYRYRIFWAIPLGAQPMNP